MTLYELAVVAVPLLAISLVLDPRPIRAAVATGGRRWWQFVGSLLTIVLALIAVVLSAMVEIGLMEAGDVVETVVGVALCGAMLLLCWFSARQMLRPVPSDAIRRASTSDGQERSAGASTVVVGVAAFVTLCLGVALVTSS